MKVTEEKCDFCSGWPSPWTYPASYGTDWGACEPCHKLIEASDRRGLVERSIHNSPQLKGFYGPMRRELVALLRERIKALHDEVFWEYCKVPPVYESLAFDGETQRSKE